MNTILEKTPASTVPLTKLSGVLVESNPPIELQGTAEAANKVDINKPHQLNKAGQRPLS